jgi:hypothetical protein
MRNASNSSLCGGNVSCSDQVALSSCAGLDGVLFPHCDHTKEIVAPDDLDVGNACNRALVDIEKLRPQRRKADHPAMQHAGHANVVDEFEDTGDLRRHIEPRN